MYRFSSLAIIIFHVCTFDASYILEQMYILFPDDMIENHHVRDQDHEVGYRKGNEGARTHL